MYLLLLILFTNEKCHGYNFLMFFNLLDLLVKAGNGRKFRAEEEVRRREEELERRQEEFERRATVVSPLNDCERRVKIFASK